MATVQIQQQATKTISVQEQSVLSIQTCLRASISALLFRRRCLPIRAFTKREYRTQTQEPNVAGMMIIERGKSYRADCLLDWLDGPALDALRAGKLRGLQLCIHPNPSKRHRVLETYSFGVWYEGHGTKRGADDVGLELNQVLHSIEKFCDSLPSLPATRFMSMNLFLHQAPDHANALPDFDIWQEKHLLFPESNEWLRQCDSFRHMSSAFHRTGLRVSYSDLQRGTKYGQQPDHPQPGDYVRMIPVEHDLEDLTTNAASTTHSVAQAAAQANTDTPEKQTRPDQIGIFSVKALQIKQALQAMQEPEEYTQGDTQPASAMIQRSQHSQHLASLVQLVYRKDKLRIFKGQESQARQQTREVAREIGGTTPSGQIILCTCGYAVKEGDLIQCQCCDTWQHAHCHGFVGKHDPRIPERHFCYICALDVGDTAQSGALLKLLLPRRAIYRAMNRGITSKTEFVKHLNCSTEEAYPIFEFFKSSGLVCAAQNSHKAGFKETGHPAWVPAGWGNHEKTLDMYFDPTSEIAEYFEPIPVKPAQLTSILTFPDRVDFPEGVMPRGLRDTPGSSQRGKKRSRHGGSAGSDDEEGPGCRKPIGRGIAVPIPAINPSAPVEDCRIVLESKKLIDVASDASLG